MAAEHPLELGEVSVDKVCGVGYAHLDIVIPCVQ